MYIEDLSTYEYRLPFPLQAVRCVGWLDTEHPYHKARPPVGFVGKLEEIIRHRNEIFDVHVNCMRGIHPCYFCCKDIKIGSGNSETILGMSEIWLPSDAGWLASPSLIIHYITDHAYLPPTTFVQSVSALLIGGRFIGQETYSRLVKKRIEEANATGSYRSPPTNDSVKSTRYPL